MTNLGRCHGGCVGQSGHSQERRERVMGFCSEPASEGRGGGGSPVAGASAARDAKVDTGTQVNREGIA